MRLFALAPGLLPVFLAACQWNHRYRLEDLDQLVPGTSTREEVERLLGPSHLLLQESYSSSERDEVLPPAPLSFVLWPLIFHSHDVHYEFKAQYDEGSVLKTGTLEILELSRTRILLFFGRTDFRVELDAAALDTLRNIRKKGIEVRIAVDPVFCNSGLLGWESIPLDDYLREK